MRPQTKDMLTSNWVEGLRGMLLRKSCWRTLDFWATISTLPWEGLLLVRCILYLYPVFPSTLLDSVTAPFPVFLDSRSNWWKPQTGFATGPDLHGPWACHPSKHCHRGSVPWWRCIPSFKGCPFCAGRLRTKGKLLTLVTLTFAFSSGALFILPQAVRVTKPNIPETIRRNYELMWVSSA